VFVVVTDHVGELVGVDVREKVDVAVDDHVGVSVTVLV
jgi:hypothetical protein